MSTARSGALSGVAAGVVALGCCVGPAVAALLGVTSAAVALDLANDLYSTWGWAFKAAGAALGGVVLYAAWRRSRKCEPERRRGLGRFAAVLVVSGALTYGLLYAGTTWAGGFVEQPEEIEVTGDSVGQRVRSAMAQVRRRYPHYRIHKHFAVEEAAFFNVGFEIPALEGSVEEYTDEVKLRAENYREATVLLLQTVARTNPTVRRLSAFDDELVVPMWTRTQILETDAASRYRAYDAFTAFQTSAHEMGGYSTISD